MPIGARMRGGRRAFAAEAHETAQCLADLDTLRIGCLPVTFLWPARPGYTAARDTRRRGWCLRDVSQLAAADQAGIVRRVFDWLARLPDAVRARRLNTITCALGGTTDPNAVTPTTENLCERLNTYTAGLGCTEAHADGTPQ
eukprot:gene7784-20701_t